MAVETDGATLIAIQADPSTHRLSVSDGITGSDKGPSVSLHDGNHVYTLLATSSGDGKTPVVVYGNSSGQLLIDSV